MNFLNFWAIGMGAFALAAPVAVHLLTKPKPAPFALSTIRFLNEVIQQKRARSRLRDWLILLLRSLCVALLAMALARPLFQQQPVVPIVGENNSQRILVIDVSQSMSAGSGGVTSWSAAVASSLQYLETQGEGMNAAVIFAGANAYPVFDKLSPNLESLREAVKQAKPRAERAEPRAALEQAAAMLAKSSSGKKELIIISDFQRTNWGTLLLDLIPKDTQVQFHSVAQSQINNTAITAVRFTSEPVVQQPATVEIELANFSGQESRVRCVLTLGSLSRSFDATLTPQSSRTFSESITFDEIGWKHGWAKLESNLDVLPEDDERPVAVRVRSPVRVLLISRQNAQEVPSSSFYLQQALNVALTNKQLVTSQEDVVQRISPSRMEARSWPPADVYVVDHPGSLSAESLQFLASQLRRGKGLLYVTAELVDAINLKNIANILGSEFQPPVDLVPESEADSRKDLFIRQTKSRETPFSVLGSNNAASLLKMVRFQGGLATRATTEGLRDQVLAELSDTSALLYLSSVGAGQIAVLNTDLGRSNWSVQPTFLPIVSELINKLMNQRGQNEQAHCGEVAVRILPPEITAEAKLSARTVVGLPADDGTYGTWQFAPGQGSVVWNWPKPIGPGVYALDDNATPVSMIATSAPSIESDLNSLDKEILTERISGQRAVGFASAGSNDKPDGDIWKWLIVGCLFGLIAEIVALRFSRM